MFCFGRGGCGLTKYRAHSLFDSVSQRNSLFDLVSLRTFEHANQYVFYGSQQALRADLDVGSRTNQNASMFLPVYLTSEKKYGGPYFFSCSSMY